MPIDYLSTLNKNGSGLNLTELASSIVAAEIAPKTNTAERQLEEAELAISAYGTLRGAYEELDTALSALNDAQVLSATSSDAAISVEINDRTLVSETSTEIDVIDIAKRQVLEFTGFSSADETVGSGTLTVDLGVWATDTDFFANPYLTSTDIEVTETMTISDVADALNAIDGVSARVLDRGDGTFTLGVVSETGAGNAIRLTANETTPGLSALDTTTTNASVQVQAAQDALLTVDGISIQRSTNEIDDIVEGMTITLNDATTSAATLTVDRDKDLAYDLVSAFVEKVNETLTTLNELTSAGLNDEEQGNLSTDRMAKQLQNQLQSALQQPLTGHGEQDYYLSSMGVATQKNGQLTIDRFMFDQAFDKDPRAFDALFSNSFSSPSANVSVEGTPTNASVSGTYQFSLDTSTGIATLDGTPLLISQDEDGTPQYIATSGSLAGTVITAPEGVTSASINFGRSLVSSLELVMDDALQLSGSIASRESFYNGVIAEQEAELDELADKATELETRYLQQFAAMEQAITELNSTGTYLTNLVESWNSK